MFAFFVNSTTCKRSAMRAHCGTSVASSSRGGTCSDVRRRVRIELATRLRTMNRILDCIVPDPPTKVGDEATTIVLNAVGRQEMTQAVTILEEVMNTNPYWLRGYLLLAAIYQYVQGADQAIATTEKGLAGCTELPPTAQCTTMDRCGGTDQGAYRTPSHSKSYRTIQTI